MAELRGIDEDYLLSENPDLLIATLVAKHLPDPVLLRWDQAHQGKSTETQLEVYDQFYRTPVRSTGLQVIVTVPTDGGEELLEYQASTFTYSPPQGDVSSAGLRLIFEGVTLTPDQLRAAFERHRGDFDQLAAWANADRVLSQQLLSALKTRRARLLQARELDAALGIP